MHSGTERPIIHCVVARNRLTSRSRSPRANAAVKRGAMLVVIACMSSDAASVNLLTAAYVAASSADTIDPTRTTSNQTFVAAKISSSPRGAANRHRSLAVVA